MHLKKKKNFKFIFYNVFRSDWNQESYFVIYLEFSEKLTRKRETTRVCVCVCVCVYVEIYAYEARKLEISSFSLSLS